MSAPADPRLILRDDELDSGLELILLAEAGVWAAVDAALEAEGNGLGRSHWRAALLLRRRPSVGVQELARLTGLSKQAASRTLSDLEKAGLAHKTAGELDARRRLTELTAEGAAFEARVSERLRALVAKAYRTGGLDGVAGTRRILSALAGPRVSIGIRRSEAA
ncbi:MarR family winged helix-turn-helix transcriptional regulator [Caulobacter sp. NIBR2454]|uniref:MarR family winged helix-turn-helix transcriptional regulator n=1 Tax=Caulobacter sp. NIBR2454 TaxID=3015996 RepID=UPI0022B71ABA|nr:MarR family transcriptional regulator [Caulobacter sp. NIBR2454]